MEAAEQAEFGVAVEMFEMAAVHDPTCAALHEMLAQCALEVGADEKALTAAKKAVSLQPDNPECAPPRVVQRAKALHAMMGRLIQGSSPDTIL